MNQLYLRSCDNRDLDDAEKHDEHQRENKGEFDHRGSPVAAHARFATETTFCMTLLKNDGSMSVVDAHEIKARATIAAATITRAYSAVACPPWEATAKCRLLKNRIATNIYFSLHVGIRPKRREVTVGVRY
jgi:hypothetical protein